MRIMRWGRVFSQQPYLWWRDEMLVTHTDTMNRRVLEEETDLEGEWSSCCFRSLTGGRKMAEENRRLFVCLLSYILCVCTSSTVCVCVCVCVCACVCVWNAWWPFSVLNLSITPCECVCLCRHMYTCETFWLYDLLFRSPVVSGWFIQGLTQSQWIGLARNDLSCHWKKLQKK